MQYYDYLSVWKYKNKKNKQQIINHSVSILKQIKQITFVSWIYIKYILCIELLNNWNDEHFFLKNKKMQIKDESN